MIELPQADENGISALDVALARMVADLGGLWRPALMSGRDALRDAWRWTFVDAATAQFDSSSGGHYTVTPSTCTCPAGAEGRICYHRGGLRVWLRYNDLAGLDVEVEQARISAQVAADRAKYRAVFDAAVLPDLRPAEWRV